ncbi:hypothetical protein QQF64_023973 [Cirrhinus molitorella]|uniref:Uncharacterized protein n=1 Tax=Cirrhinus molitorella TaxID=172907 RepID=A0ABR3NL56_9TELE
MSGREAMVFEEPANQEGEAFIRKCISNRCPLPSSPPGSYSAFPIYPPAPHFAYPPGSYPPFPGLPTSASVHPVYAPSPISSHTQLKGRWHCPANSPCHLHPVVSALSPLYYALCFLSCVHNA